MSLPPAKRIRLTFAGVDWSRLLPELVQVVNQGLSAPYDEVALALTCTSFHKALWSRLDAPIIRQKIMNAMRAAYNDMAAGPWEWLADWTRYHDVDYVKGDDDLSFVSPLLTRWDDAFGMAGADLFSLDGLRDRGRWLLPTLPRGIEPRKFAIEVALRSCHTMVDYSNLATRAMLLDDVELHWPLLIAITTGYELYGLCYWHHRWQHLNHSVVFRLELLEYLVGNQSIGRDENTLVRVLLRGTRGTSWKHLPPHCIPRYRDLLVNVLSVGNLTHWFFQEESYTILRPSRSQSSEPDPRGTVNDFVNLLIHGQLFSKQVADCLLNWLSFGHDGAPPPWQSSLDPNLIHFLLKVWCAARSDVALRALTSGWYGGATTIIEAALNCSWMGSAIHWRDLLVAFPIMYHSLPPNLLLKPYVCWLTAVPLKRLQPSIVPSLRLNHLEDAAVKAAIERKLALMLPRPVPHPLRDTAPPQWLLDWQLSDPKPSLSLQILFSRIKREEDD